MTDTPYKLLKAALAGLIALVMLSVGAAFAQDISIVGYNLENSKRVGRTTFEYEYSVDVQNATGSNASDVSVTVSSSSTAVIVVDAEATIGDLTDGAIATSGDTISVQVDRRTRFSPAQLDAEVDFEDPPLGFDENGDGIWDDVESSIDRVYFTEPLLRDIQTFGAISYQETLNSALANDEDKIVGAARARQRWVACLIDMQFSEGHPPGFADEHISFIKSFILTNRARIDAYRISEETIAGMQFQASSFQMHDCVNSVMEGR